MKLPLISASECVKALEKVAFYIDRQRGSHIILKRTNQPPNRTVVVPNHSEIARGTLKEIIEQAGLTPEEFLALLD